MHGMYVGRLLVAVGLGGGDRRVLRDDAAGQLLLLDELRLVLGRDRLLHQRAVVVVALARVRLLGVLALGGLLARRVAELPRHGHAVRLGAAGVVLAGVVPAGCAVGAVDRAVLVGGTAGAVVAGGRPRRGPLGRRRGRPAGAVAVARGRRVDADARADQGEGDRAGRERAGDADVADGPAGERRDGQQGGRADARSSPRGPVASRSALPTPSASPSPPRTLGQADGPGHGPDAR